jgi:hypothetical protein
VTAGPGELLAEVAEAVRASQSATISSLDPEATLWLAAAPAWTAAVAADARFPVTSLAWWVDQACRAGLGKVRGDQDEPDRLFWMPDEVRRDLVGVLLDRIGKSQVNEVLARIALRASVASARLPDDQVPGALREWAGLMASLMESGPPVAAQLVERVQQAVAERDLARAQDLVTAGEPIACLLGGSAEQALSRSRRLLALGRQRRQDERALVRYLDRSELSAAVTRLLERRPPASARPGPWAMHLRGVGGVGKTMLIRYLASGEYARDRGVDPFPLARADFDHISPDYPVRRPVQLLLELADELALHTAGNEKADRTLAAFRSRAARAHEAVSGLREAGGSPLQTPEVARAVNDFGTVLSELDDVLLILDTCEELAKADMGNPAAPAVRATFEIMEHLHARAPRARFLLAGRRPLPGHDYLAVQPVAGFTVTEARAYLAREHRGRPRGDSIAPRRRRAAVPRTLTPGLADAMIAQSPAIDGPVPREGGLPERVSPFDLALYATWADEDPELSVAQVSRGSDAYIEGRIIERLDDPLVVRALPVLAAAGRCRVATMAAFLGCDPAALAHSLAAQEWIDADGDPASAEAAHVTARPALARRLRGYFGAEERRAEFAARSAALASFLVRHLRDEPLAGIDVDELVAALRLATSEEAAALWDRLAERAMEPPGRWLTLLEMTRRILGEWEDGEWEDGAWPTRPALGATVTAAHIAASRRAVPFYEARSAWEAVRDWATRHPDPTAARHLRARAALGLLPYAPDGESLREAESAVSGFPRPAPELAAAIADAAHRCLEAGRTRAAARLTGLLRSAPALGATPRIAAWADVAQARLSADGDAETARACLAAAESAAAGDAEPEPSWPDWIPPDDLLARIRIEQGLITPPDDSYVLSQWENHAEHCLATIDGERLASLCLQIRLRHMPVDAALAGRWEALDAYTPERTPTCTAHDLIPPLCVSVAAAWLSAGDADRALNGLSQRSNEARGTRVDEATVRHADVATMKIVRRLRLTTHMSLLFRLAGTSGLEAEIAPPVRYEAWRTLALLDDKGLGLRPQEVDSPAEWHAWWQSQGIAADALFEPGAEPEYLADIQADLAELQQIRNQPASGSTSAFAEWLTRSTSVSPPTRSAEPYRDVRAALRMAALRGEDELAPRDAVPTRVLAEMAFEEAELTALRLPEVADRLFNIAASVYARADDPIGSLLALTSVGNPRASSGQARMAAGDTLARRHPELAAKLNGDPEDAGPWRYWAERVRRPVALATPVVTGPGQTAPPTGRGTGSTVPPPGSGGDPAISPPGTASHVIPTRRRVAYGALAAVLLALAGLSIAALTGAPVPVLSTSGPGPSNAPHAEPNYLPIALVAVVSALALVAWPIPKRRRLAERRGVGAVRLATLLFDASIDPEVVSLGVGQRRTVPPPGFATTGYTGYVVATGSPARLDRVQWTAPRPAASARWWGRGSGPGEGLIRYDINRPERFVAAPWERVLSASLAPEAAGRIQWVRIVSRPLAYATYSTRSVLSAPPAWARALGTRYSPPRASSAGMVAIHHVIGRAVTTAAGPCMDVSGGPAAAPPALSGSAAPASTPGADRLLGTSDLKIRQPGIIILQAEPVELAIGDFALTQPDDQPEKLALAAELAQDGAPAVLVLPILPDSIADEIARAVAGHASQHPGGHEPTALLTRLRAIIAPHVPPPVLDDIVLFLNEARHRLTR